VLTPRHAGAALYAAGGNVYSYGYARSDLFTRTPGLNYVYALDAGTGALRWKWEVPSKADTFMIGAMSADRDAAYLWLHDTAKDIFGVGVLLVLEASTGKEKWRRSTSMWTSLLDAPALLDPHVVLVSDNPSGKDANANSTGYLLQALDRTTGGKVRESQTPWKYHDPVIFAGGLFVSDHKVHQLLDENNDVSPDSWVSAVDLSTGKELWRSQTVELGVFTRPAAGDGMVVVGSKPFTWDSGRIAGRNEVAGLWAWPIS
jgi:outer membrane protein assembly factor BamB